ncbi:hypothetical protein ANN_22600 [Periplaneta americana]|uniref:Uncharacterized protein n=1 Tax=Periplaneta americana TaxID=6978 RepID=A0ABQ8S936_PERAM|nr:hypothetical protein ANN_22600 [Periplaneta americana]
MSDEAQFHLSGFVNRQNVRYWSQANPRNFSMPKRNSIHKVIESSGSLISINLNHLTSDATGGVGYMGIEIKNYGSPTKEKINKLKQDSRIPNLTGPVASMTSRCSENKEQNCWKDRCCHGDCTSCRLCYASKILRNFRTPISFEEKIA